MSDSTNQNKCPFMDTTECPMKKCPLYKTMDMSKANECPYLKEKCPHFQKAKCCKCVDCKCVDCKCTDDECKCPTSD